MTLTMVGTSGSRGVTRQLCTSTAFGSTSTGMPGPSMARTGCAARSLTADQCSGRLRSRSSDRARAGTGPYPDQSEWTVTSVGTPIRAARRAASIASGDHTETCTCTTSGADARSSRDSASSAASGESVEPRRCTQAGSGTGPAAVVVATEASTPERRWCATRSLTCISIPPSRGR